MPAFMYICHRGQKRVFPGIGVKDGRWDLNLCLLLVQQSLLSLSHLSPDPA